MQSQEQAAQKWKKKTKKLLELIILEGKHFLRDINAEDGKLQTAKEELNTRPKTPFLLAWILKNAFLRRTILRKIGCEEAELEKMKAIIGAHLERCNFLHENLHEMSKDDICASLRKILECWFVKEIPDQYRLKFIHFSSEVRVHDIEQLLGS
jgi:hypothetical protein